MKMKKLLKTVTLISIVLLCNSVFAVTPNQFIEEQQNNTITLCEDAYGEATTSELYECMLSEFYGLNKVISFLIEVERKSKDWTVLMNLFEEYYWPDYDTYDFMAIHIDFEEYLEGKEK